MCLNTAETFISMLLGGILKIGTSKVMDALGNNKPCKTEEMLSLMQCTKPFQDRSQISL